ncbi:MAG: hypothetical protein K2P88_05005 [Chitinophagaceae bacterium]|nr:hypothetical protein [Chitinophagaceae bacterium]
MKEPLKLLKWSLGIMYCWFGVLKFFPGLSPAEQLAGMTIETICCHIIPASFAVKLLAVFETAIGLSFFLLRPGRLLFYAFTIHIIGTFVPLFLFPEICFKDAPFVFTIVGQYIVKNLLFIVVAIMMYQELKQVSQTTT